MMPVCADVMESREEDEWETKSFLPVFFCWEEIVNKKGENRT